MGVKDAEVELGGPIEAEWAVGASQGEAAVPRIETVDHGAQVVSKRQERADPIHLDRIAIRPSVPRPPSHVAGSWALEGSAALEDEHPGDDLFSQGVAPRVSSALESLTAVFGMGTGVTSPLASPG